MAIQKNTQKNNHFEDTFYSIPRYIRKLCKNNLVFMDVYEAIFQFWNKGKVCYLSNEALCERAKCKERQVQKALLFFEKHGELRREKRGLKRYLIKPEATIETNIVQGCTGVHPCTEIDQGRTPVPSCNEIIQENQYNNYSTAHSSALKGCTGVHPEYNEKLKLEKEIKYIPDFKKSGKKKSCSDYKKDERFMRFYNEYPRHVDPHDAYKAFKAVVGDDNELLEEIIRDIKLRAARDDKWTDKKYIKYPAVYLRKGEYLSEILNTQEEAKIKQEQNKALIEKKRLEQERFSLEKANREREDKENKQKDAGAYRKVVKQIKALEDIKNILK